MPSKIGWTTETWNPVSGCTKVSSGCKFCYAEKMAKRLQAMGSSGYEFGFAVCCHADRLSQPQHWRKPRLVFVCSMGDLFHKNVPTSYIERVFAAMADNRRHIFQVLTKRPARMATFVNKHGWPENVWLGTSVEDHASASHRLLSMRNVADGLAATERKFVSYEPALGPVTWDWCLPSINWLIVGCESGSERRPFDNEWAISAVEHCQARGIPVFVKQIIVDGRVSKDPSEWPPECGLRVQEYPPAMMRVLEAADE